MADAFDQTGPIADVGAIGRWNSVFAKAAKAAPSLLYALRLWAAVAWLSSSRSGSSSTILFGPAPPRLSCASRSSGLRCARAGSG